MSRFKTTALLKALLYASLPVLYLAAATSFFVGGRILHEAYKIDRITAEVLGIGFAMACAFAAAMLKRAIGDLDWEEAKEKAAAHEKPKS